MVRNPRRPPEDATRVRSRASGRNSRPVRRAESGEDGSENTGGTHGTSQGGCHSSRFPSYSDCGSGACPADRSYDWRWLPDRAQAGDSRGIEEDRMIEMEVRSTDLPAEAS